MSCNSAMFLIPKINTGYKDRITRAPINATEVCVSFHICLIKTIWNYSIKSDMVDANKITRTSPHVPWL